MTTAFRLPCRKSGSQTLITQFGTVIAAALAGFDWGVPFCIAQWCLRHTVSCGVVKRSSSWGCRSAMESLGVYLFAGAFCYPEADSRPSYAVQNAPISAQANGDWPGSKSTGGTNNMLSILWTILIGFNCQVRYAW